MNSLKQLNHEFLKRMKSCILVPGITLVILFFHSASWGQDVKSVKKQIAITKSPVNYTLQFTPVTITTEKLTISGGGILLPPKPPFLPVNIKTEKLTISGGGIPLPPKPPFPGVTITITTLTISGKSK
jgi:hypothetical protein